MAGQGGDHFFRLALEYRSAAAPVSWFIHLSHVNVEVLGQAPEPPLHGYNSRYQKVRSKL